jgi:hypothetical protein
MFELFVKRELALVCFKLKNIEDISKETMLEMNRELLK